MSDSIAFSGLAFKRRSDFISGLVSTKRPVIYALNYDQGDTEGGGQNIVITGNDFRSATTVTFGVAGNASFAVNSNTQITATLPEMKFGSLPSFDGANDFLANATTIGTLLPVGSYFYWVLFRANTIVGTASISTGYSNDAIFVDSGGYIGPHLRLNGSSTPVIQTYHWTGGVGTGNEHEITIGKWHCLCVSHDGVNIYSSLDGGAVTTLAAGAYDSGGGTLQIVKAYLAASYAHVDIAEIGMIGSAQSTDLFTTIVASLNADYNLNLGDVSPVAYDRTLLACTLLLQEGNYDTSGGSGVWTGTASAGSSGGRNATEATTYPTARTPGHEALVDLIITNNIGASSPVTFEYWDPTVDGTTRVVYDSIHTAYETVGNTWTPRYVKPRVNKTYTGLIECINSSNTPVTPAPTASSGAPVFPGDGTAYGLRTRSTALQWLDVFGVPDANTHPGTIVLVQKCLETGGVWSGAGAYDNDAFIGEHAGGTIGLGGTFHSSLPVVAGHLWHPSSGYRAIKVDVSAHEKAMVFSRFTTSGANFGVGVNGDTSGSTYSEEIHVGGNYTAGAGVSYASNPLDFGYKYDASTSAANQTQMGVLYTAVVQDKRASDATITKLYKWTQQRFGVGAADASPTITSLNYSLGDTAGGGQSIVLTGTNMDTVTSVTFGGTSATITAQTSTTCTVTLPAHAVGAVTVIVTNPSGVGMTSFEYWDPTEITGVDTYLDSNKGVTTSGSDVTSWVEQVNGDTYSVGVSPTLVSNVFGTMPGIRFTPGDGTYLVDTGIAAATVWSIFGVAAWTSSDTSALYAPYNPPLTLFGGSGGWSGFGASGGGLQYTKYDTGAVNRGSGLNDGNPHLIGASGDATPTIKIYAGATQLGSDATPGGTADSYANSVGQGYSADGWDGDIGAIVVCTQVISAGDLTKLNNWAKQRFGSND